MQGEGAPMRVTSEEGLAAAGIPGSVVGIRVPPGGAP